MGQNQLFWEETKKSNWNIFSDIRYISYCIVSNDICILFFKESFVQGKQVDEVNAFILPPNMLGMKKVEKTTDFSDKIYERQWTDHNLILLYLKSDCDASTEQQTSITKKNHKHILIIFISQCKN